MRSCSLAGHGGKVELRLMVDGCSHHLRLRMGVALWVGVSLGVSVA